ncbi:purine-cytosine permease [Blumeria hordei DH14]|uniref:Purine-cytosine permease n=1 Tax=Blumeria graminis f. sp. hordei (strain DH14) TaxID=546991 RepID=N1JEX0_BLUG1|nr:purine-cytosine permease [Blumeria hordei DH14]
MVVTSPHLVNAEENSWENNASPVPTSSFNSNCNTDPSSTQHASRARVLCQLQRAEEWLDEKMGIETQGIDRILEENKQPPSLLNMFLLWWSLICHVGSLPIGMIGPELGLTFGQSVTAITIGTMFGAICTAFCGSLGPKLGLRAIATARFSFGYYGTKFCSLLNVVIGIGYTTVNVVVVGQILSAVSDYKISIIVGCVIISILGYLVSLFGFKIIHTYEKYSWISIFIVFCILYSQVGHMVNLSYPATSKGLAHTGAFLSFLAINFSSSATWSCIAADYYCNYPATTPSWKIWTLTYFGIVIPTIFANVLGACLGNIAFNITSVSEAKVHTYAYPALAESYQKHGLGGILRESYHPLWFSKIVLVLLVFSVLGNNVATNYSVGLSLQLMGTYFHAVPRFIWSLLIAFVAMVIAIAGRESLSTMVINFVSMLGYWSICFTFILALEDKVFRRKSGYDLELWNVPSKLPWGVAAITALFIGYLGGAVTGMAQSWYIGPIARIFGTNGGDVGIYLTGICTAAVYIPARWYEFKISHR